MKILNRNLFLLAAFASITLSSCLKDKGYEDGEYNAITNRTEGQEFVSIPVSSRPGNVLTSGIEQRSTPQVLKLFALSYDAAGVAPEDFTATVELNNSLITTSADTILLPASMYSIRSTTINFKKGDRISDSLTITVPNGSTLDSRKLYALGFTLTSVSKAGVQIPANLRNVIVYFAIKNQYDGIYKVIGGRVQRYTAPSTPEVGGLLNGPLAGNPDVTLTTINANTVEITGHQWAKGSNSGVAGIDNLRATIDPVTNQVTMSSVGNPTLANWSGKVNRYDPLTKTFYLAFDWNQTANRREYEVVLQFDHPRP